MTFCSPKVCHRQSRQRRTLSTRRRSKSKVRICCWKTNCPSTSNGLGIIRSRLPENFAPRINRPTRSMHTSQEMTRLWVRLCAALDDPAARRRCRWRLLWVANALIHMCSMLLYWISSFFVYLLPLLLPFAPYRDGKGARSAATRGGGREGPGEAAAPEQPSRRTSACHTL